MSFGCKRGSHRIPGLTQVEELLRCEMAKITLDLNKVLSPRKGDKLFAVQSNSQNDAHLHWMRIDASREARP